MIYSGQPFSFELQFTLGLPGGAVSWTLGDPAAAVIASGAVTPPALALSTQILIPGAQNELPAGHLFGSRYVDWSYTTGAQFVSGRETFTIEAPVPFGVSADGVRSKLGVEKHELQDKDIDLLRAYVVFKSDVDATALAAQATTGSTSTIYLRDAIEAVAALELLPSLTIKLSQRETSGTDEFQRMKVDFGALAESLGVMVSRGRLALDPTLEPGVGPGAFFTMILPSVDPVTGA